MILILSGKPCEILEERLKSYFNENLQLTQSKYEEFRAEIMTFVAKYLSKNYPEQIAVEHLGLTFEELQIIQSNTTDHEQVMVRCLELWLERNPCGLGWLKDILKQAGIKDGLVRKQAIEILAGICIIVLIGVNSLTMAINGSFTIIVTYIIFHFTIKSQSIPWTGNGSTNTQTNECYHIYYLLTSRSIKSSVMNAPYTLLLFHFSTR